MSERLTRSQTGTTPRKPSNPGFVETPGRRRYTRKSMLGATDSDSDAPRRSRSVTATRFEEESQEETIPLLNKGTEAHSGIYTNGHTNGFANGFTSALETKQGDGAGLNGHATTQVNLSTSDEDHKVDKNPVYEFGGSWGVSAMMIGFPALMYYMWIGATYYDGKPPTPAEGQGFVEFLQQLGHYIQEGAYPHRKAWAIYWVFFITEGLFYLFMPGIYAKGKALPHLGGKQLSYYCSAQWSWYVTNFIAFAVHFTGVFPLYTLIDEFGPLMSVAIISGFGVAIVAYFSALIRGAEHRMTGYPIYDFFMGAELNPRMFGWLDFKMFFEVRIPWYILYFVTLATVCRQYEQYGYVSAEVAFVFMAHFLYANACSKGEELIVTSWDMYFEKWGFMLIFWNLAGVPLSYCHCTLYLANHDPAEYQWAQYQWSRYMIYSLFVVYLFVYWVWDTCNCQKNYFRAEERGGAIDRKSFPQLPYRVIKNPQKIPTQTGDSILCDGWYGKARKIHYACDTFFALSWGFITGFQSPFPWFYPFFFTCMIIHRALRDIHRCREKYGEAWLEYERRVPYLFIPYVI